jgi:Protein of unknown function (DUF2563)
MFVNTDLLHSGASESRNGGSHAGDGADHLSRTSPTAGMFGDFAAADEFHESVAQAHSGHTAQLRAHQATLEHVANRASTAATAFTKMDAQNAAQVKAVGCNSTI